MPDRRLFSIKDCCSITFSRPLNNFDKYAVSSDLNTLDMMQKKEKLQNTYRHFCSKIFNLFRRIAGEPKRLRNVHSGSVPMGK